MKSTYLFLVRFGFFRSIVNLTRKIILPGFQGLPLFDVTRFFVHGLQNGGLTTRASSLAFRQFLALFPGIIFLFTLIPYIPVHGFQEQLLGLIHDMMPYNAYMAARETIEDIVKQQRGGLLSLGFVFSLYFSANSMNALITSFNQTAHTIETRKPIQQYIAALLLTISGVIILLTSIGLIIFTKYMIGKLVAAGWIKSRLTIYFINDIKWIIICILLFCMISLIYYYGPAKRNKFRFISAGSSLATLLTLATSVGFTFFVNHFGKYNKLYGSIGTLIVIMLWIYFNALVMLIGFELNASIGGAKKIKQNQHRLK